MALQNVTLKGKTPAGSEDLLPIDGVAWSTNVPLGPNEEKSTGWIKIESYKSLHYIIQADQAGIIQALEYSTDGVNVSAGGTARAYNEPGKLLQTFVALKDNYFRIRYQNGSVAQSTFFFATFLSSTVGQNTMNSIFLPVTPTNVASITKSIVELSNGTDYDQVHRTGNSMNVHVDNMGASTDVSLLAKDSTLKDGTQKVQVTNLPGTQPVSGNVGVTGSVEVSNDSGNPLPVSGSVSVSNLPATQPVSGSVSVSNFPANQVVSGTVTANVTFPTTQAVSGSVSVSNLPATQAISAAALPLPSGASTSSKQDIGNAALGSISDLVVLDPTQNASIISLLKGLLSESLAQPSSGSATTYSLTANVATNIPANNNGKGRLIYSSSGTILIGFGFTATATLFSVRIITNGFYEVPPLWSNLSISLFSTAASSVNVTTLV